VGKLLDELLQRRNLREPLRIYEIQRRWPSLVGAPTAARTWPTSLLQRGVLVVHVADSTWVQELTYLKAEILAKIQAVVSPEAVTELRFYVSAGASSPEGEPSTGSGADPAEKPAERPLAPDVAAALDAFENELDSIKDPDLRRSIRRAFVEHLLRS
jgi:predicted nucleic acid-binding Zn ribbon protein